MKTILPDKVRCKIFKNDDFELLEKDINDFLLIYNDPKDVDIIIADSNLIMDGNEYVMAVFYEEYLN